MSWFAESTNTNDVAVEVKSYVPFFAESGEYVAKVDFASVYASPDSKSKGLYISFKLENGMTIDQYVNYQNKEGKTTREVQDAEGKEKTVRGFGLDQIESWNKVIGFGKPSKEVSHKMWGKDRMSMLLEDAVGKKIGILVRQVKEPSEDGSRMYDKNEVEAVFDLDSRKTAGELYFEEDDTRHQSISEWLEKIAKKPILERKGKSEPKKTDANVDKAIKESGW